MAQVRQDNVQIKLEIDGSQSRTELDNLSRKSKLLQEDLKGLKKGSQEYIDKNKEISQVTARMGELQKEIGITGLNQQQLTALTKQLGRELALLTPNTESFLKKAQELAEVNARLQQVKKDALGVREGLEEAGGGFLDFVKKSVAFAGIQLGIQGVISGLKQVASESIDAAVEGSDSIADMEKSLNVTTEGAEALRAKLASLDTRTSQADLEGIAVAGGQLGVAAGDVDAFAQSVDQAVVALGDEFSGGVADVTKSIGGLQKLFKETADLKPDVAITKIGSALNALGADGSATAPVIAEFAARIGQLGDLAPQITQTLGLGAAFQELGLSAEISSGGVTNVLLTASKETDKFAKQLGMTDEAFKQLLNSDPNEVLLRLAESLRGASNTKIVSTLDALGIKSQEATKVVSLLANQTDIVRQKQVLASAEMAKGTSLTEEFNKKNTNAAAEVAKAEKGFAQFRLELGEQLIPIYLRFLQLGGLLLDVLKAVPAFVGENKTAFGLLALAVLAFNAAQVQAQLSTLRGLALQKLVALGVLTETGGKYSLITATELQTAAQTGLNAAMAANPIGFVLTLLALFAFGLKQLYDRSETFRAAVDSLFTMLRPLGALFGSLASALGPVFTGLSKFFGSFSSGKGALDLFGQVMALSVVLPIKLMITQVQLAVDALALLWDAGKRVANFFGADFKVDNGALDTFTKNATANAKSILTTLTGQDAAVAAAQKAAREKEVQGYMDAYQRRLSLAAEARAKQKAADAKAAAEDQAATGQLSAEALKERLANIKAALALVQAGSAEELRLKKLEVATKRDIDLLAEKLSAGDKNLIRAEALRDLRKLQDDYDKKTLADKQKQAKEEADIEKKIADLKAGLIQDELTRKLAQLTAAAEQEKAVAKGTAAQVAEQRRLIDAKLALDLAAARKSAAEKEAAEALAIEQSRNELIKNEWDRRAAQLLTAARQEAGKILDTDANAAVKRQLVWDKYNQDVRKLGEERAASEREIAQRIAAIDNDIAMQRIQRRKEQGDIFNQDRNTAAQEEQELKKKELQEQYDLDIQNVTLTNEEKLALKRKLDEDMRKVDQDYLDWSKMNEEERTQYALGLMSQAITAISDFQKIASDKELAKVEKDKKKRLDLLDAEYKAGKISKEQYEKQKSNIEANYDEQTRSIKQQAAEKDKQYQIANSIIQGTMAVLAAAAANAYSGGIFSPVTIATGIAAALATAKIIATPIPEFAFGGVAGPKPTWRERVRQFARGGINATAGVADVGQRHSGGGIRMVDGATGEHLGEWERGEPYMILSRDTYANNKALVDDLLDTSMYRGGAPVRPRGSSYYEDGGVPGSTGTTSGSSAAGSTEVLVQAVRGVEAAVRSLPSRQRIAWGDDDTAEVETRLDDRANDRASAAVK